MEHDLDGMLIANALHYCKDAKAVLQQCMRLQKQGREQFLIIEYDSTGANRWVPYPLPFNRLKTILASLGFDRIEKLSERPSLFRRENLYSVYARH